MVHTLESIAKLAGVSRGTVSHVVNNRPGVNLEVRERVLQIIKETGYHPNSQARSLAGGKTHNIGVVVFGRNPNFLSHHIFHGILLGIQSRLTVNMYDMLLFSNQAETDLDYWKRIADKRKVDGLIMMGEFREEILMYYQDKKLPFVLVGKKKFQQVPVHMVTSDYRQGAYIAVRHLLEQGRGKIVFLRGFPNTFHESEKLAGYRQALSEASIQIDLDLIIDGKGTQESAFDTIQETINNGTSFDGIVSVNDLMAFGAIEAIQECGQTVPGDVSVVGYDDIQPCAYFYPKLSTVRQDLKGIGVKASDLLMGLMSGDVEKDKSHEIFVDNELIIRNSSVPV